jgi:hypothetical protein
MRAPADLPFDVREREPSFARRGAADSRRAPAASSRAARGRRHYAHERSRLAYIAPLAFAVVTAGALLYGWHNSEEGDLTPGSGVGYWLGIAGASAMLLLLFYPLRKRVKGLRGLGSVGGWFRLHMVLGIVGPALVLFHANFKLGALNSNVALFAMLTVAASGLIGRYLYRQIHLGLYGRRAEINELLTDVENLKNAIEGGVPLPDDLFAALDGYATHALAGRNGAASSFLALLGLHLRAPGQRARLIREAEQYIGVAGKQHRWSRRLKRKRAREMRKRMRRYFAAVNTAAAFVFYERLFALWHVLHLPFFFLLVLAAIVHVIAVHLY